MPESCTDRPTKSHEYIFLFTKNKDYYWDQEAVRERAKDTSIARAKRGVAPDNKWVDGANGQSPHTVHQPRDNDPDREVDGGRNIRSVWQIATHPYRGAHFATFPPEIPRRCILAGSKVGDTVLDPFAGSGTTLVVAKNLGRDALGIDISAEYYELAMQRLLKETD